MNYEGHRWAVTESPYPKKFPTPVLVPIVIVAQLVWATLQLTRVLILGLGGMWFLYAVHITLMTICMGVFTLDIQGALQWYWDIFLYWTLKMFEWWIADMASMLPGVA